MYKCFLCPARYSNFENAANCCLEPVEETDVCPTCGSELVEGWDCIKCDNCNYKENY